MASEGADVWVVETFICHPGSMVYLSVDSVWSSDRLAVDHLEGVMGARREDPDCEEAEDTCWLRDGPGDSTYVWYVYRYGVDDG